MGQKFERNLAEIVGFGFGPTDESCELGRPV